MKILHVVTYISPDGSYGGPVRVAINQAKALTQLGHTVVVAAAAGGFRGRLPTQFDGFPVHLFPARRVLPKTGFAGLTSPALLRWLGDAIRQADAIHIHLARDLVTLPAAVMVLAAGKPLVVQTHGMIDSSSHVLAAPLDRMITRSVLDRTSYIFHLTDKERDDLNGVAGHAKNLVQIPNGVTLPTMPSVEQQKGPQGSVEVLYLARLHKRKRPMFVVEAARKFVRSHPNAQFVLVGPDEGEANRVQASIEKYHQGHNLVWEGALGPDCTLERMRRASLFVLPSTDEPFPMSVLEAMSLGIPVIVTDTCGIAKDIQLANAGIICDDSLESFNSAIEKLLSDAELRLQLGSNARNLIARLYSIEKVAERLFTHYEAARAHAK